MMTEEPGQGHNSLDPETIRAFVERIESVDLEISDMNAAKSEVYAEMKAQGLNVKIVRRIITERRVDPAKRQEQEAVLKMYREALGMRA